MKRLTSANLCSAVERRFTSSANCFSSSLPLLSASFTFFASID